MPVRIIEVDDVHSGQTCFEKGSVVIKHAMFFDVDELQRRPPDFILILPWNLKAEIIDQLSDLGLKGTRFVTAVPNVSVTA